MLLCVLGGALACTADVAEPLPEVGRSHHALAIENGIQLNRISPNGIQLNGVDLNSIQRNGIQLNGIQLNGIQLNELDLNGIQLNSIRLNSIRLNGLDLNGIQRNGIQLNGIQLNGIQLNELSLNGIQLNGIQLNEIQLNGIRLNGIQLNGIQLNELSLNGIQLNGIRFTGIQLNGIQLNSIQRNGVDLDGVELASFEELLSYMVSCGLAGGQCVTVTDVDGSTYPLCGQDGLAPTWDVQMLQSDAEEAAVTQCVIDRATAAGDTVSHTNVEAETVERVLAYTIKCALPSSGNPNSRCTDVTRLDGSTVTYCGEDGLDPGWKSGAADPAAGDAVAACVVGRAEAAGDPVLDYVEQLETIIAYMVGCALPAGTSVTLYDENGDPMTVSGSLGMAPWWQTGALSPAPGPLPADAGEKRISACLAARSNGLAKPVRVSLRGPALSTSNFERQLFLDREGGFWGNLFTDDPHISTCEAAGSGVIGRVCTGDGDCGFTRQGPCSTVCGGEDTVEGYFTGCHGEAEVVTTFLDLPKNFAVTVTHGCAAEADGSIQCWGSNEYGELGDGNDEHPSLRPQRVAGLPAEVSHISAARKSTAVRVRDGRLFCWGRDSKGQCGDGVDTRSNPTPQLTLMPERVSLVAGNDDHRCAMLSDGQMYCYGRNNDGQLGIGSDYDEEPTPQAVPGMEDTVRVTTGGRHSCGVLADGSVRCWGRNSYGQVGKGTTSGEEHSPVTVVRDGQPLLDITDICAGGSFTCGRDLQGDVYCWGVNYGPSATLVTGLGASAKPNALACGAYHACTLGEDGQVWCWGSNNDSGQLGRGSIDSSCAAGCDTPQPVSGLSDVVEIDVAGRSSCAKTADGALWCWGANFWGQLGDRTRTTQSSPVQNLNYRDVTGCGDGVCHARETSSCALDCGGAPVCGDGTIDAGEACDDGVESVTCNADCTFASCGDGICNGAAETYVSCNADCAPPQAIVISQHSDRSSAGPLDGRLLYGTQDLRIFVSPDDDVSEVVFRLDGAVYRTDSSAPFDFVGNSSGSAVTWDSTTVADGDHTIEADITTSSGTFTARATFTVDNATSMDYDILVTTDPDRSGGMPLEQEVLVGDVFVFVWPEDGVLEVSFDYDGSFQRTENNAPFDFKGGNADTPTAWDTTGDSDGTHTIDAVLELTSGQIETVSVTFTINNGGSAPYCGDGTCGVGEDCSSCASDCGACGAVCGDAVCDAGEDCSSCASDCGACGGPHIWIEAESGTLAPVFEVRWDDASASGGAYIRSPEGSGSAGSSPDHDKLATYTVTVPASGDYNLWGRVWGAGNTSNSFWVIVDGGTAIEWHHDKYAWLWDRAGTFTLSAGTHEIAIGVREDGDQLDRLVLTSDLTFTPTGTGP